MGSGVIGRSGERRDGHSPLAEGALLPEHGGAQREKAEEEDRGCQHVDLRWERGATGAVHVERIGHAVAGVEQRMMKSSRDSAKASIAAATMPGAMMGRVTL